MTTEYTPRSDKELWRSLAMAREIAPAAVSDLDFAAWLEGRLSEVETAQIDAAVTSDPEMRRAALELADILGKPLPAAPARMATRAQALVGFAAEKQAPRRSWLAGLLPTFSDGFAFQRGAMAGAAVVVAAVGFMMGGGLGQSYAHDKYAKTNSAIVSPLGIDTTNELNDLFVDNS